MASDFARYRAELRKQLGFLERSTQGYDAGFKEEAIRIAVVVRTLFHDTSRSVSLLTHLGADDLRIRSTCPPRQRKGRPFAYECLCAFIPGMGFQPKLGSETDVYLPRDEWWTQLVHVSSGTEFTRRDLVRHAADKDGGAHVDHELTPAYAGLKSGPWTRITPDGGVPIPDHNLLMLRQIGFEVLMSPDLRRLASVDEINVGLLPYDHRYVDGLVHRAEMQFQNSQVDRAKQALNEALEYETDNHRANLVLGCIAGYEGDIPLALELLAQALALAPDDVLSHRFYAKALAEAGRDSEAEPHYRRVVDSAPNDLEVSQEFLLLLRRKNDVHEGLAVARKAAEAAPGDWRSYSRLGAWLLEAGEDTVGALEVVERALELNPASAVAHANRAIALAWLGRLDDAIDSIEAAVRIEPACRAALRDNDDLAALRGRPRFEAIVAESQDV